MRWGRRVTGVEEPFTWQYVLGAFSLAACLAGPLLFIAWWTSETRQRRRVLARARRQLRHVEAHEFAEEAR